MGVSMTFSSIATMFVAMIILASVPDSSALAVVARSIASGFTHGLVTVLGIVTGDFVFIIFAVYGLESLANLNLFAVLKYLGAIYLVGSGIALWMSKPAAVEVEGIKELSWLSNFMCGLLITLGDPKAIIFYLSFLPAFLDFSQISLLDTAIILALATLTAGGVKLTYAYMANKARLLFNSTQAKTRMNISAGVVMICTGIYLVIKV
ncbi:MAG: LysE family translocator [Nitrospina sp.]|jgi:threonine/homoserine/homoserine lactone efflux protein|nr:LysE family translocator [Nitrospina sp.]